MTAATSKSSKSKSLKSKRAEASTTGSETSAASRRERHPDFDLTWCWDWTWKKKPGQLDLDDRYWDARYGDDVFMDEVSDEDDEPYIPEIVDAGAFVHVHERTEKVRSALKGCFPDWEQIYAAAFMRLVHGADATEYRSLYRNSVLPAAYPGSIDFLEDFPRWLGELGEECKKMSAFMRDMLFPVENAEKEPSEGEPSAEETSEQDPAEHKASSRKAGGAGIESVRFLVFEAANFPDNPRRQGEEGGEEDEDGDGSLEDERDWVEDWANRRKRHLVYPRLLLVFDMSRPEAPLAFRRCAREGTRLWQVEKLLEECGLDPAECLFFVAGDSLAGCGPRELLEKGLKVVRVQPEGTLFDGKSVPTMTDNDHLFQASPVYWDAAARLVAARERMPAEKPASKRRTRGAEKGAGAGGSEDAWRCLVFLDRDWQTAALHGLVSEYFFDHDERKKLVEDEQRCRKRGFQELSDRTFESLRLSLRPVKEIVADKPHLGTVEVETNILDWSIQDLFGVCLRARHALSVARFLSRQAKRTAWNVSSGEQEEGWFFVDLVAQLMEWAVFPHRERRVLEALDYDVSSALRDLDQTKVVVDREPGWLTGRRKWKIFRDANRILNFDPEKVDILDKILECREEADRFQLHWF